MRFFHNLSIRRKQTLIILFTSSIVLFLACAAFVTNDTLAFRRELVENVSVLAEAIGNNCAAAIDFDDPNTAADTLAALHANANVVSACVYKRDGQVFAVYQRDASVRFVPPAVQTASQEFGHNELHLFRPVKQQGEVVGTIFVASSLNAHWSRLQRYLGIAGLVCLASLFLALLLSSRLQRLVSDPILHLAQVARTVAAEKNYSVRATRRSHDELGQLVDGFNEMLAQIQLRDSALQAAQGELELRVEARTKELAESQSLYHSLVDQMPAGVFRKDAAGRYVFVNSWFCRIKGMSADLLLGKLPKELAAYELASQTLEHPEASPEARLAVLGTSHHELIMETGRRIEAEEEYLDAEGQPLYLRVVKSPVFGFNQKIVGSQGMLFDVTGRKQAEAELTYQRDLLQAMLDHSPDQIYFKDAQSRFLKVSRAVAEKLGLTSADELVGKRDADFFREEHARPAFEDEQEIIRTGQPLIGKMEKEVLKTGRVFWALTTKMPFRGKDGRITGTFGISKDITAIKEAEAQMADLHRQLLETSRRAGMAEIATNVLHNIGNVVNSVNVSASLVADGVKKARAISLVKVVALLREHEQDLGTFFTSDPRGKKLCSYLSQLTDHFLEDQQTALKELSLLRGNIDHIKEIVAMQQNYAKASGLKEIVCLTDLVEDSLRMNVDALNQHRVEIVREFDAVPPVNVEKHKTLQILLNLLRNARHACQESACADRRLTVRVASTGDRVRITVMDNGVGIPAENLTRIFNHGFTTRKDGHGFGLHSGALAAKEMGGTLSAHSDGVGQGATFTLELPLRPTSEPTIA